jgi:hypothetical protein
VHEYRTDSSPKLDVACITDFVPRATLGARYEPANRPIAHALLEQLPGQSDGLGALLGMRFSALALAVALADAVAGKPQLGDCHRIIDLK